MNANGGVNMLLSSPNGLLHALDVLLISVHFIHEYMLYLFPSLVVDKKWR